MKDYLKSIEKKLKDSIKVENIEIKDNSSKHKKHKFFNVNKYHIQIKIKSTYLNSLSKIDAQRLIMKALENDLKTKIHALEINIEQ
tara:strand:+ start:2260 stop:2517 length:258 start_codon:yes stop_codon:yes gene_type:complete